MKRIIALLIVLCLLLCACGKKPVNEPTVESTTESTAETQESTQESTVETTPQYLYHHPLTGEPLQEPWSGQVTAVMINNLKKAMPQKGISQADMLYEIEVEGDITRMLALFTDFSDVEGIGPVRSARTAFNSVAVSYDAPLVHCGGSPGLALAGRYGATADTIANWQHIDQAHNDQYFYRDTERYNSGYAWEHVLFTTGEKMQKAIENKGYYTPAEQDFGLQFEEGHSLNGDPAEEVTITFKGGKKSVFTYDTKTRTYKLYQHGQDHIDGNTGEVVTFRNVIAIYTEQWYASDGMHKFYETIGSGEGYAALGGQIIPIRWQRDGLRNHYTYTLADGTPLTLDVGNTYVAVVGTRNPIAYK